MKLNLNRIPTAPPKPPPSKEDHALRSFRATCAARASAVETQFKQGRVMNWQAVALALDTQIPLSFNTRPLDFLTLKSFLLTWQTAAVTRFVEDETARQAQLANISTRFVAAEESANIRALGDFTLKPRQVKAIDLAIEVFKSKRSNAVVIPLEGGEGKSVIAWALIEYWRRNAWFGHPVGSFPYRQALFATRASVVLSMKERARECGVLNVGKSIDVVAHSSWSTKLWKPMFEEKTITVFGNDKKVLEYLLPAPAIMVIDECQDYKYPDSVRSKYIEAIVRKGVEQGSFFVFTSATPFVNIENTWLFCLATGRKWEGHAIDADNFAAFTSTVEARAGDRASSDAVMKQFRLEFNDCFVVPPRDKKKFKANNSVKLVDFVDEDHRAFYTRALDRYRKELKACGKDATEINPMTALLKFAMAEELCKIPNFVDLAMEAHADGFAPVIGLRSQNGLRKTVQLLTERGVPRSNISIIWGGTKIITKQWMVDRYSSDFDTKSIHALLAKGMGKVLSEEDESMLRHFKKYCKDQAIHGETSEDVTAARHERLLTLKLNAQSLEQRQAELNKFKRGETQFCVFLFAAAGVGVDLDHQRPEARPRKAFLTICYWAEEFLQAMMRCSRLGSLSNTDQMVLFFKNTIVAEHMAPILDRKIKSISASIGVGAEPADMLIRICENDETFDKPPDKEMLAEMARQPHDTSVAETSDDEDFDDETALEKMTAFEGDED